MNRCRVDLVLFFTLLRALLFWSRPTTATATEMPSQYIHRGPLKVRGQDDYEVYYRRSLEISAKRARYPGFNSSSSILKAGSIRREGAKPLPCDILFERDVPITMRDGTVIYTDVFRPVGNQSVPAIIAWSPYGKQICGQWFDDIPGRSNVPLSHVSELQKFEGPDPAYWVAHGYAIVNPDPRGAYSSEGKMTFFGRQLAEDGYDVVEAIAEEHWCSGKVAFSGNSWLAISQWFIAASGGHCSLGRPAGPVSHPGGKSYVEDVPLMGLSETSLNKYWNDKIVQVEKITIPAYVVAIYTNMLHTSGTFEAFNRSGSSEKLLRVHNSSEWPDYYDPAHVEDLRSFFDCFLKMKNNDWRGSPRVRLSVLDPDGNDTINRPESQWPPATTTPEKLYPHSDATLHTESQDRQDSLSYAVNGTGSVQLNYTVPNDMEVIGNMRVHLWVEASGSNDMDISISVQKLQSNGKTYTSDVSGESTGNYAATGLLRVSRRHLGVSASTLYQPVQSFDRNEPLKEHEIVPIDLSLWPIALRFRVGEILTLSISAKAASSSMTDLNFGTANITIPGHDTTCGEITDVQSITLGGPMGSNPSYVNEKRTKTPSSSNKGSHTFHMGGQYDSYLLMPVDRTHVSQRP